MEAVEYCLQDAAGCFAALIFVYSVYRLAKLDLPRRMAGILGFLFGATAEALNVDLTITVALLTEWTIFGCFLLGVLFQREIKQLLRLMAQNTETTVFRN